MKFGPPPPIDADVIAMLNMPRAFTAKLYELKMGNG
jgi:hypothetical protein